MRDAASHLERANQEIARRERAEIAYTLSDQKRLVLIDRAERAESQLTALRQERAAILDVPLEELQSAVGLVASERNRWESHDQRTFQHWGRVYTILAGFLLASQVRHDLALNPSPTGQARQDD